jgi:hypothetical protein
VTSEGGPAGGKGRRGNRRRCTGESRRCCSWGRRRSVHVHPIPATAERPLITCTTDIAFRCGGGIHHRLVATPTFLAVFQTGKVEALVCAVRDTGLYSHVAHCGGPAIESSGVGVVDHAPYRGPAGRHCSGSSDRSSLGSSSCSVGIIDVCGCCGSGTSGKDVGLSSVLETPVGSIDRRWGLSSDIVTFGLEDVLVFSSYSDFSTRETYHWGLWAFDAGGWVRVAFLWYLTSLDSIRRIRGSSHLTSV